MEKYRIKTILPNLDGENPSRFVYITRDGTIEYFENDILHRIDGPAIINPDGKEEYVQDGKYHRDKGPAFGFVYFKHGVPYENDTTPKTYNNKRARKRTE